MSLYPPSTGIRVGRRWVGCSPGPHVVQLSCSEPSSEEHETRRRSPGRRPREKEPEMEAQAAPSAKRKVVPIALAALPLLFAIAGPAWRAVVAAFVAALAAGAFNPAQPGRAGLLTVAPAVVVAAVRVSPNALSSPTLFLFMLLIFPGVIAASGLVASYAGAGMARALRRGVQGDSMSTEDGGGGEERGTPRPEESEQTDNDDQELDTPSWRQRAWAWVEALLTVPWP